ncbi:MAG TPA: hypothetical protein VFB96_14080 [Pirellulaceae bacterium]|nr:hypothetical protein [Pirellulaceae bacterium]
MSQSAPLFDLLQWGNEHLLLLSIVAGLLTFLAVALLSVAWVLLRRRKIAPLANEEVLDRSVDVAALDAHPPAAAGPQLEVYGTPVRVAVVVMAPPGRGGSVPPKKELPALSEFLVPNLGAVLIASQPLYVRWSPQLSSQGFVQSFFNKLSLPGDHGKGTVWCSLAGKFEAHGQLYLVGLVCCASAPNGLGEITVEHPGEWLQILRARVAA